MIINLIFFAYRSLASSESRHFVSNNALRQRQPVLKGHRVDIKITLWAVSKYTNFLHRGCAMSVF